MTKESRKALVGLVEKVSRVRRWLVALAVLKGAAAGLLFVTAYIAAYSVADHYIHMPAYGRAAALLILVTAIVYLLYLLVRTLGTHLSFAAAAQHVESGMNLDQQLVTAIEYYENERRYPYSKALAEHIVTQVHRATVRKPFDSTVPKWQAAVSVTAIVVGLIAVGVFLNGHYRFFTTYLARLARPLEDIAPLPATVLVPVTADVAAEYGTKFALEAEIQGKVPQEGTLEIAPDEADASSAEEVPTAYTHKVYPAYSEDRPPRFRLEPNVEVGVYRYRFTAAGAATDWYSLRVSTLPKIKQITAKVTLAGSKVVEPYTQEVKDFAIAVLKGSQVELSVKATEPLARATAKPPGGQETTLEPGGSDTFRTEFRADSDGGMSFALTSLAGVKNERIPPLAVTIKLNEAPKIELASPDGDCLVADVASIPISFEVSDDFGVESAQINIEVAGRKLAPVTVPVKKGARTATLPLLVELEEYPLTVGDTIVYYAEVTDIDIGTAEGRRAPGVSDIQLIEIRPYRVLYFPPPQGGEVPPAVPMELPDTLADILEYSRAILKKTWVLAAKGTLSGDDRAKVNAIKGDVDYCVEQLDKFASDPRTPFVALAGLNATIDYFGQAKGYLSSLRPDLATEPEKKAYQELRKLVEEMYRLARPGAPTPPKDKPDALKVADNVHLKVFDSQIVAEETEMIADEIAEAAQEERTIDKSYEHFLADTQSPSSYKQQTNDETSWTVPGPSSPPSSAQPPAPTPGSPQITTEGPGYAPTQAAAAAASTSSTRQASPRERLQMLEARQQTLRNDVSKLNERLRSLPEPDVKATDDDRATATARKTASAELDGAESAMEGAEQGLAQLRREGDAQGKAAEGVSGNLADASEHLENARDALVEALRPNFTTDELLATVENLETLANAYERNESPEAARRLEDAVESAQRQLAPLEARASQTGTPRQAGTPSSGSRTTSNTFAYPPKDGSGMFDNLTAARLLAARFWTLAMQARKETSPVTEGERSNAELNRLENKFYEDAARYGSAEKRK